MNSAQGLFLRKINIKKWNSPVAVQYSVRSLPRFELYGPSGKLLQSGRPALQAALKWKGAGR